MVKNVFKTFHLLKENFKKASSQVDREQETMRKEHKKMAEEYRKFSEKINKRLNDWLIKIDC